MVRIHIFESDDLTENTENFEKRINEWVNLHREITIVDYDFGYDADGNLETVVVKWK